MNSPIRFALVGAGGIARSYVQAFRGHPDARLVSVADVRYDAAQALAATAGDCHAFDRPPALVEGPDFDAVLLCTPPNTHEGLAVRFLEMGKHVLCEKPFTVSAVSARRMLAAAAHADRVLTMASKFRYVRDVIVAKEMIADGLIGDVVQFENAFTSRVDMTNRWNSDPAVSGGGVLIDNGAHSFDLARYFLGPLVEVHVVAGRRLQPLAVEDTVHVFLRAGAGTMGTIDLSWTIHKERESFLDLFGEKGTIRIGWKESKYKTARSTDWTVFGPGYDKVQAFRENLGNFARHLRDGETLRVTPADALANVTAIDAGYKSLRKLTWTPLAREVGV
jgi:predicted dehydrogenase